MRRLEIGVVRAKNNREGQWSAEAADLLGTLSRGRGLLNVVRSTQAKALRALADQVGSEAIGGASLDLLEEALFGGPEDLRKTEAGLRALADIVDPERRATWWPGARVEAALRAIFSVVE